MLKQKTQEGKYVTLAIKDEEFCVAGADVLLEQKQLGKTKYVQTGSGS